MRRAIRVGITGKIGSGKSTLSAMMSSAGITVIDTDTLAKEIMQSSGPVRQALTGILGASIYKDDVLDRAAVAAAIFGDDAKRLAVEAIVHPAVTEEIERQFAASPGGSIVAVESALILQTELWRIFDYIILIEAADEAVLQRIAATGKISSDDAAKRLADQSYNRIRRDAVDITIQNSGTHQEFERRARSAIELLKLLTVRELPDVPLHSVIEEEPDDETEEPSEGDAMRDSFEDVDDSSGFS